MQRKRETRPAVQSIRRVQESKHMVSQPSRKVTHDNAMLMLGAAILFYAFIAWHVAGAFSAILGAVVSAAMVAILDLVWKGEWN